MIQDNQDKESEVNDKDLKETPEEKLKTIEEKLLRTLAEMENHKREKFDCFAEAIIIEFENCHTNFRWGRNNITLEKMDYIGQASERHGFSAVGLKSNIQTVNV